jgi:hypothetical protein
MSESRSEPPLSPTAFVYGVAKQGAAALFLVVGSLVGGMAGYVQFEGQSWLDGFLKAAMLLGGMGPVESPVTPGANLFAGLYALYAGMVFLVVASIMLAPVVHRGLQRFHWNE